MAVICGKEIKVYIETSEGEMLEISGAVAWVEYRYHDRFDFDHIPSKINYATPVEVEVSIRGTTWKQYSCEGWEKRVDAARSASEWFCDYCKSVNLRSDRKCPSCGGARSFLYD